VRHVLITGLPNYVAVRLLACILEREPGTTVSALVRPEHIERTQQFLTDVITDHNRVTLHVCDVVLPDLGLGAGERNLLLAQVTDVYHLASLYHLGVAKRRIEEVNIRGTRNMLRFAGLMPQLRCFNHHSTAFVCGDRSGVVLEEELEQGQRFRNTFERTKFTAELEVRRSMRDIPAVVYRPSLVLGDATTGVIDRFDGPNFLIQLLVTNPRRLPSPSPPMLAAPFNVVPVNFVADAMYHIGLDPTAAGRTFQIVDPNPLSYGEAMRVVGEHVHQSTGRRGSTVVAPPSRWRFPAIERYTRPRRALLHELDSWVFFNSINTAEVLRDTGVYCPPFSSYAGALVDHVHRRHEGWHGASADDLA